MNRILLAAVCIGLAASQAAGDDGVVVEHVRIAYEEGRYAGWPANYGIWIWDNEILIGYSWGYYMDMGERHHLDRDKPTEHRLARSLDGGHSWTIERPYVKRMLLPPDVAQAEVDMPAEEAPKLRESPGGVDFTHPDFGIIFRADSIHAGRGWWYYTYDRGHTWDGPFVLPNFGAPGIAPRTDYIVDGPHSMTAFITAAKSNEQEGRPLCIRTLDGGATWELVGEIGPEPETGFAIMPSSVRLSDTKLLTTVRRREGRSRRIMAYVSEDNGATWRHLNTPVPDTGIGNPSALIKLQDGRLALTYGVRAEPWRIAVKLSEDEGATWSGEIVLRDDGGDQDIGYCQTVQRPDGKVVTVYYFHDAETGPERYVGATIWDPARIPFRSGE